MDPRHPELAVSRMNELLEQYNRIEKDITEASTSAKLGELEREGGLVVQEICMVAPRLHDALIKFSRNRRHDISRNIQDTDKIKIKSQPNQIDIDKVVENVWKSVDKISSKSGESEEELTFEQQAIKYTLELDKEIEEKEKQETKQKAKKKATKKKKAE